MLAAKDYGVSADDLLKEEGLRCGVPYVIPTSAATQLASEWLAAIDRFKPGIWESIMYAFGFAVTRLKMPIKLTYVVGRDFHMSDKPDGEMIHYCYSHDTWDKRKFVTPDQAATVWDAEGAAPAGSIMDEILIQLREARQFYSRIDL